MLVLRSLLLTFISLHGIAFAEHKSSVSFGGIPKWNTVQGIKIPLYPEASIQTANAPFIKLGLTGSGVREVTVLFIPIQVYFISSYIQDPTQLHASDAISGIRTSPYKALSITVLRYLQGYEVRNAFEEALDANKVNINAPEVQKLLNTVELYDLSAGDTVTIAGTPSDTGEELTIRFPKLTVSEQGVDIALNFWRIWFGIPSDSGMEKLKVKLVGN